MRDGKSSVVAGKWSVKFCKPRCTSMLDTASLPGEKISGARRDGGSHSLVPSFQMETEV